MRHQHFPHEHLPHEHSGPSARFAAPGGDDPLDDRFRSRGRGGPWGGGRFGGGPPGRGRGGRGRRGDVRAAVLALLSERPMHGYEMLQELASRTHDLWRPSPGSLYPALQLLEDQGLVRSSTGDGRRRFDLTDEGRAEYAAHVGHPGASAPWDDVMRGADAAAMTVRDALHQVGVATGQLLEAGTPDQKERAGRLLVELRRQLYLMLAEPNEPVAPQATPADATAPDATAPDATAPDAAAPDAPAPDVAAPDASRPTVGGAPPAG